jgi:polysaccharide export outer membrane protein
MNGWRSVSCIGVVLALGLALALPAAHAATPPHVVKSGDVLELTVYAAGEKRDVFTAPVASNGSMIVPFLGWQPAAGLTTPEIGQRLQTKLGNGYYVNPQVLVNVKEYGGRVFITGEVKKPGMYELGPGLTVLNACILAGGFTDFASLGKARIARPTANATQHIKVDLKKVSRGKAPDLVLQDGDRVEVPRRSF